MGDLRLFEAESIPKKRRINHVQECFGKRSLIY